MNGVRILISLFILVLLGITAIGWTWTSGHQPPAQAAGSHVVLGLSALAGIIGLFQIWRAKQHGRA